MKYKYAIGFVAIVAALIINLSFSVGKDGVTVNSGIDAHAVEAPPLMDEYTHACTWVGLNTASVRAEIIAQDGSLGSVTITATFIYDTGSEVSCEAAWAWCSQYGPCVRTWGANPT